MINMSKWALDNRKLINFVILCLIVGGIMSYYSMSKLEDPAIKVKQAMIVTAYPGASAHQVELEVTDKIEKSLKEMSGIDNIQSQSYNDLSIITAELETTVKDEISNRNCLRAPTLLLSKMTSETYTECFML